MASSSRDAKADAIVRSVHQLFKLVGLPEWTSGSSAGYHISAYGGRVQVSWSTQIAFNDEANELWLEHPDHPMVRLERAATGVMERAMMDVLYCAGFTVALVPGVPNRVDVEKDRDPEVLILAGPEFKAWSTG